MISLSTKVVMLVVSAALLLSSSASAAPVLAVTPTSFSVQANVGTNVSARTVQISNPGNGILKWSVVAPTANWLSVAPTSGTNAGTLTLTFQTSTLAAGNYQTSFTVRTNSQSVTVNRAARHSERARAIREPNVFQCAGECGQQRVCKNRPGQ